MSFLCDSAKVYHKRYFKSDLRLIHDCAECDTRPPTPAHPQPHPQVNYDQIPRNLWPKQDPAVNISLASETD